MDISETVCFCFFPLFHKDLRIFDEPNLFSRLLEISNFSLKIGAWSPAKDDLHTEGTVTYRRDDIEWIGDYWEDLQCTYKKKTKKRKTHLRPKKRKLRVLTKLVSGNNYDHKTFICVTILVM